MQPNKFIGVHSVSDDDVLSLASRIGIYWNRLWDNGKATAWTTVQPRQQGEFIWSYSDNIVNKTLEHGLEPIGVISWPYQWERNWVDNTYPSWIHKKWNKQNNEFPDITLLDDPTFVAAWKQYVNGVVQHYSTRIKYWELLNEPYRTGPPEWVARLYAITAPIIRIANPQAQILGPCTHIRKPWTDQLLTLGILENIDIFSYHGYGMRPIDLAYIRNASSSDGKKRLIFDTENSGSTSARLFCKSCLGVNFTGDHDYAQSAGLQARSLLQAIGEGTNVYVYYWMVHYDAYDQHRSFLNYDGSLRSSAIAYTVAAWLIRDIELAAPFRVNEKLQTYIYKRKNGTSIAAMWNTTDKKIGLRLTSTSSDVKIMDLMGNKLALKAASDVLWLDNTNLIYFETGNKRLQEFLSKIAFLDAER
jgi:hypothetical protein